MEFPDLGQNCHESTCSQLDFLPMRCDSCSNVFCKDHITYEQHKCAAGFRKDVQVPVCPLCNKPVPVKRGEAPDIGVSDHIDRECQSDPAVKKRKVYSNRCTKKGCKQKELVPVICSSCHKNFCLKHRHSVDHDCQGFQNSGKGASKQGAAAINRHQNSNRTAGSSSSSSRNQARPQQTSMAALGRDFDRERRERMAAGRQQANAGSTMQAGMSEDEAMARAIQMSLAEESKPSKATRPPVNPRALQQEDEDLALARALAASEEEERNRRRRQYRRSINTAQ
ncbi:AN1-type zinc finger protein 2A isoform X2 [Strongylocentrotus purpuratus]|uniref:AN1-type domain-containing protein n=1 Tax=Strongylocentrotus purpuratus TaxID=7668 RepID=A0A7M7NHK3_STRPU|nr:AN1-type zinc finger protein 2A isoform X2 [Strongylocentrotus purpuratus]|eukprot:XP_011668435.1 PREDICTED: AN1-type zinc finger protein 2A isoform X2 [Strongylocentrotus purpuratus]